VSAISVIYIDVLFAVNFILNTVVLCTEARILKLPIKLIKLFLGSALGAFYACFVYAFNKGYFAGFTVQSIFAVLITYLTFGKCSLRAILKRTAFFFAVNWMYALMMLGILYFTDIGIHIGGAIKNGVFYFNLSLRHILIISAVAAVILRLTSFLFKKHTSLEYAIITIYHKGKTVELTALIDTGNSLKDPISGKCAVIVQRNMAEPLFDHKLKKINMENPDTLPLGFRLIPFSCIGSAKGVLPAFIPENLAINGKTHKNTVVAIFDGTLSQNGDFNAITGPVDSPERTY